MLGTLLFSLLMVLHGVIHFAGFFKAFEIGEFKDIEGELSKLAGLVWLAAGLLFLVATLLYLLDHRYWAWIGLIAILYSQVLIFTSWSDAKFGTIANLILIVPILRALINCS